MTFVTIEGVQFPEGWVWVKDHELKVESEGDGAPLHAWVDGTYRHDAVTYAWVPSRCGQHAVCDGHE